MRKRVSASQTAWQDLLEGQPESGDTRESAGWLGAEESRDSAVRSPSAETGMIPAVSWAQAEGHERDDLRDASRMTVESAPVVLSDHGKARYTVASVLILEDTIELAEVIQATLERMSLTAVHETHGGKALSRYEEMKPDVVLLDLGLPDMNGWKFLEAVKDQHKSAMPTIIVITAYGDPANRLVGKLQGVHDYLIKPFTSDEVERVVASALQSRA